VLFGRQSLLDGTFAGFQSGLPSERRIGEVLRPRIDGIECGADVLVLFQCFDRPVDEKAVHLDGKAKYAVGQRQEQLVFGSRILRILEPTDLQILRTDQFGPVV